MPTMWEVEANLGNTSPVPMRPHDYEPQACSYPGASFGVRQRHGPSPNAHGVRHLAHAARRLRSLAVAT
jgi:hypothetical protein